jgi:hypothetical protein
VILQEDSTCSKGYSANKINKPLGGLYDLKVKNIIGSMMQETENRCGKSTHPM